MITAKEQYVVDEQGVRTAVLLDIERYEKLLEAQEELESIRAFDKAKASNDDADLVRLAETGGAFDFLHDEEDIYSVEDLKKNVEIVEDVSVQEIEAKEEAFEQKLLAEGFISSIPARDETDKDDDFEPIEFEGEPLSEQIIRERR